MVVIFLLFVNFNYTLADPPVTSGSSYMLFRDTDASAGLSKAQNFSLNSIASEPSFVEWSASDNFRMRSGYIIRRFVPTQLTLLSMTGRNNPLPVYGGIIIIVLTTTLIAIRHLRKRSRIEGKLSEIK